jgi:hypothetical protein
MNGAFLSATKKLSSPFTILNDLLPIKMRPKKYIQTIAISISITYTASLL